MKHTSVVVNVPAAGISSKKNKLSEKSYRYVMQTSRQKIDSLESQLIKTPYGLVEYAQFGAGDPILVLHGNGGGCDHGLSLARDYLDGGFWAVVPSRFGYLRTPLPENATVTRQADAYVSLLDHLGIRQAVVLAISAGVTSAVRLASRHPERVSKMILLSPNAPGEVDMVIPPKAIYRTVMSSDFMYWLLITLARPRMQNLIGVPKGFHPTPQMEREITGVLTSVLPISRRIDGTVFDTYISNPEINEYQLTDITAPTLVISAIDDPMALHQNARTLADQIPNARLFAVRDGGHLFLGHAAEVKSQISQFLHTDAAK